MKNVRNTLQQLRPTTGHFLKYLSWIVWFFLLFTSVILGAADPQSGPPDPL